MHNNRLAGIIIACTIAIIVTIVLVIPPLLQTPKTYTLSVSVSPSGAGRVSPSGGQYSPGTEVTLTASPASSYVFDHWSGAASGTTSSITIAMNSDKTITANFRATTRTYALTVNVSPSGAGSVSPSGGQYPSGAQVTLTASPASGYSFDHWSGSASGTVSSITITMDSDKSVTANFRRASPVSSPKILEVWDRDYTFYSKDEFTEFKDLVASSGNVTRIYTSSLNRMSRTGELQPWMDANAFKLIIFFVPAPEVSRPALIDNLAISSILTYVSTGKGNILIQTGDAVFTGIGFAVKTADIRKDGTTSLIADVPVTRGVQSVYCRTDDNAYFTLTSSALTPLVSMPTDWAGVQGVFALYGPYGNGRVAVVGSALTKNTAMKAQADNVQLLRNILSWLLESNATPRPSMSTPSILEVWNSRFYDFELRAHQQLSDFADLVASSGNVTRIYTSSLNRMSRTGELQPWMDANGFKLIVFFVPDPRIVSPEPIDSAAIDTILNYVSRGKASIFIQTGDAVFTSLGFAVKTTAVPWRGGTTNLIADVSVTRGVQSVHCSAASNAYFELTSSALTPLVSMPVEWIGVQGIVGLYGYYGNGRVAICNEHLTIDSAMKAQADNAQLLRNILRWLTNQPIDAP